MHFSRRAHIFQGEFCLGGNKPTARLDSLSNSALQISARVMNTFSNGQIIYRALKGNICVVVLRPVIYILVLLLGIFVDAF